ncbi:MAG: hypothetical protein IJY08_03055 [Clostridia bacterium]|nr:hypothetical protein [Clostridia bacterium]
MNKNKLKEFIFSLCSVMSVSGFEKRAEKPITELTAGMFDSTLTDAVGNRIFIKKCGKQNAPRVLIDAHLDEIGMIVTEVCKGGFLRIANLGGIDVSIMQAADVIVYGEKPLRGVIASTPPHLKKDDKLPAFSELLVDTGLSEDTLKELVDVGTPVGFAPIYGELLNGRLIGKSFDDKACAACALLAIAETPGEELAADVYVMLSATEETNRLGGVAAGAFRCDPDYAMVIDVNLARVPDTKDYETVEMDKGISISLSAATDRRLSMATAELCRRKDIPFSLIAAPSSTGTNATTVNLVGLGIPTVDVGLPLACMHTYNEVISMTDAMSLARLVREFVCSKEIAAEMTREEVSLI